MSKTRKRLPGRPALEITYTGNLSKFAMDGTSLMPQPYLCLPFFVMNRPKKFKVPCTMVQWESSQNKDRSPLRVSTNGANEMVSSQPRQAELAELARSPQPIPNITSPLMFFKCYARGPTRTKKVCSNPTLAVKRLLWSAAHHDGKWA